MRQIFYIHGFASGRNSSTGNWILNNFDNVHLLEYNSNGNYQDNLNSLITQIKSFINPKEDRILLIGSSLGGFYAADIVGRIPIRTKCILINPSITPRESLKQFIGENTNFSTNKKFIFTQDIVESYPQGINKAKFTGIDAYVLLGKNDEVLDYRVAENFFKDRAAIEYLNCGHRLNNYNRLKEIISEL